MCILIFIIVNWPEKFSAGRRVVEILWTHLFTTEYIHFDPPKLTQRLRSLWHLLSMVAVMLHLWFLIEFQGVDTRWWASFGCLLHVVMFIVVSLCVRTQMTFILISEYVFFLCTCCICVVQLDTCLDLFLWWVLPE